MEIALLPFGCGPANPGVWQAPVSAAAIGGGFYLLYAVIHPERF